MLKLIALLLISVSVHSTEIDLNSIKELAKKSRTINFIEDQKVKKAIVDRKKGVISFLPTASASYNYTKFLPSIDIPPSMEQKNNQDIGISINQPLFLGGKLWYAYDMVKDLEDLSRLSKDENLGSSIFTAIGKYLDLLQTLDQYEIQKRSVELSKRNLDVAKERNKAGLISDSDILNMESGYLNNQAGLASIESGIASLKMDLANFLDIDSEMNIKPISNNNYQSLVERLSSISLSSVDELKNMIEKMVLENSRIVKMNSISIATSENSLSISKSDLLPNVNLSFSSKFSKSNLDDSFEDQSNLTLSASLPIFPIVDNLYAIERSKIELKEQKEVARQAKEGLSLQAKVAINNLISSSKMVKANRLAFEYGKKSYFANELRFKKGLINSNDMLDAEILYSSTENNYKGSFYTFIKTLFELEKLTTLDQSKLINIILSN